jgi:hypothetical protein
MPLIDGKWHVVRGDCMWNISRSVYGDGRKWPTIADANGVPRSNPVIYPGQVFTIPGITTPTPVPIPAPQPPVVRVPTIDWFALDAGTTRSMFCTWSFDRADTSNYEVKWEYDTGAGGWRIGAQGTTINKQSDYSAPENAKKVKVSITPKSDNWSDGQTASREYDFSNNPPELPPIPSFDIDELDVMTIELTNIQNTINANAIEFAIYQDDTFKYRTGTATINQEARYCKFTTTVDPGHRYKVRCRAVRGTIYSGWTDYTDNDLSTPVAPSDITTLRSQKISEQQAVQYAVFVEWPDVPSAKNYLVEWATNIEYFDTGEASSQTTEEGAGPRLLVTGIELGHEYFFRVASLNEKGKSKTYTPIKSVRLGTRPAAPTTYSNVNSCVLGEDLKLYWIHNSTDGSIETTARIHFTIIDSAHPELEPTEIVKVIPNNRPEEEKTKTSVYVINTDDPEWATVGAGYIIKWKVQTAGVIAEYSEWSVEREVNVYAPPELSLDVIDNNGNSIEEINTFPFYISLLSEPPAQTPISYYIEVVALQAYQTVDEVGKVKMVSIGDKVYQKYYDPQDNPWRFLLEMTPGNIDLENNIQYAINATVSLNSGLSASSTKTISVYFDEVFYDVFAEVIINKDTYEASIHPYCNQYDEVEGEIVASLVENCTLAVYRKEYDGTFTLIESGVANEENLFVTDPHPSLDYARYRVVATMNDTGAISYADIPPVKYKESAIIIQWAEEWSSFNSDNEGSGVVEPAWSGSLLKLPYNITISENNNMDVSLINYVGRKRPVSYYGTHLGETATWNVEIPKDDKETLYAIRRLSIWTGDVYVREPSGTGYWANVSVSYSIKYSDLVIPVTITITRVEGGI